MGRRRRRDDRVTVPHRRPLRIESLEDRRLLAVAGMENVPESDQRRVPWSRVANGDDVPEARIDVGAVEWQANPLLVDSPAGRIAGRIVGSPTILRPAFFRP